MPAKQPHREGLRLAGDPPNQRCTAGGSSRAAAAFKDEFHVAGLNWTDAGVTVLLDGAVVNTIPSPCLVQEIGMDFDRETMPLIWDLPDPAALPDRPFEVDYVRAWKRIAP